MTTNEERCAKNTYKALCTYLDQKEWHYTKDDEKLEIATGARGDDLPIHINITVDKERQLAVLLSTLGFALPEEKRTEGAVIIAAINNRIINGCFDYQLSTGRILFRLVQPFHGSVIAPEVFEYVILCSCGTVDQYNDKLFAYAQGEMDFRAIMEFINK